MLTSVTVDFDETITVYDTTPLLPRLAAAHLPPEEGELALRHWDEGAGRYYALWQEVFERGLNAHSPTENPGDGLVAFAQMFRTLEQESIESAVAGGCLRGIPRHVLVETGASVPKRRGALETLAMCQERGIPLAVISANWAKDMVRGGMSDLDVVIHANTLDFDDRNLSTGAMSRNIVSAMDKRAVYQRVKQASGWGMYVGDSVTDLLALFDAEVGIIIGDKPRTIQVCEHFGIAVRSLKTFIPGHPHDLYRAESWDDIRSWLESENW